MQNPLDEVRLDEMSREAASACKQSKLNKSLSERSRTPSGSSVRRSRSDTDQRDSSRDRSKSKHRPHRSRSSDRSRVESGKSDGDTLARDRDLGENRVVSSDAGAATAAAAEQTDALVRNLGNLSQSLAQGQSTMDTRYQLPRPSEPPPPLSLPPTQPQLSGNPSFPRFPRFSSIARGQRYPECFHVNF